MRTKKFTDKEIATLETAINRMLKPINGIVHISKSPMTVHCSRSNGGGSDYVEWDEFLYSMVVTSDKGNFEFSESFQDFAKLPGIAWYLASEVFFYLDGNMDGPLAENLWPKANNWLPDVEKLLDQ